MKSITSQGNDKDRTITVDSTINWLLSLAHDPWSLAIALAVATLVSEDGALITGSLLVGNEMTSPGLAIFALTFGIAAGDVGLYGLGALAKQSRFLRKRLPLRKARSLKSWLEKRQTAVLFSSRFLPGTRLPTYVTFGFFGLSLIRFTIVMSIAAIVWVSGMVLFVSQIQQLFSEIGSTVGIIGGIVFAFAFVVVIPFLIRKSNHTKELPPTSPDALTDTVDEMNAANASATTGTNNAK
jgi:membrane protein DedA with SNARE-associated domain